MTLSQAIHAALWRGTESERCVASRQTIPRIMRNSGPAPAKCCRILGEPATRRGGGYFPGAREPREKLTPSRRNYSVGECRARRARRLLRAGARPLTRESLRPDSAGEIGANGEIICRVGLKCAGMEIGAGVRMRGVRIFWEICVDFIMQIAVP